MINRWDKINVFETQIYSKTFFLNPASYQGLEVGRYENAFVSL